MIGQNKIISNLSNKEYHKHHAISSSNCKDLLISPWSYHHKKHNPIEPSLAMKFGTMFHSLVLEPKLFDKEYLVADVPKRNTKQGKLDYQELIEKLNYRVLVNTDDFLKAQDMSFNLEKNNFVQTLLSGGQAEQSVFWTDEATQTQCKARADYINIDRGYIVDLKTTSSLADDINFKHTTRQYNYDLSAAFYVDGFQKVLDKPLDFFIVVIEKDAPYNYAIYKFSSELLEIGRAKYNNAISVYEKANKSGVFNQPYNGGNLVELVA